MYVNLIVCLLCKLMGIIWNIINLYGWLLNFITNCYLYLILKDLWLFLFLLMLNFKRMELLHWKIITFFTEYRCIFLLLFLIRIRSSWGVQINKMFFLMMMRNILWCWLRNSIVKVIDISNSKRGWIFSSYIYDFLIDFL